MTHDAAAPHPPPRHRRRRLHRRAALLIAAVLVTYLVAAYLILPFLWSEHEERHPALADVPGVTHTGSGIPGDPLNVGLIGGAQDLHRAMLAAHWYPADPITLESSLRIAEAVVLRRSYDDAPVSSLYLFGRKQDFAFERPVGADPSKRHHVRFWRADKLDAQGRPFWFGSATFDVRVGLSDDTGQVTHHIGPDVDADRDLLIDELRKAGALADVSWIDGFHKTLSGRNGGGDPWHTDGRLAVGVLAPNLAAAPTSAPSTRGEK